MAGVGPAFASPADPSAPRPRSGRNVAFVVLLLVLASSAFFAGWVVADHRASTPKLTTTTPAALGQAFPRTATGNSASVARRRERSSRRAAAATRTRPLPPHPSRPKKHPSTAHQPSAHTPRPWQPLPRHGTCSIGSPRPAACCASRIWTLARGLRTSKRSPGPTAPAWFHQATTCGIPPAAAASSSSCSSTPPSRTRCPGIRHAAAAQPAP